MNRVGKEFNDFCIIVEVPYIGEGTWIGYFTVLDGSGCLEIGSDCNISSGVHIYTHDTVSRCIKGKKSRKFIEKKATQIGDNVFIGANSVILKGVTIGNQSIVGAGSVVLEGTVIGERELWAGNPAKFVKKLDVNTQFEEW